MQYKTLRLINNRVTGDCSSSSRLDVARPPSWDFKSDKIANGALPYDASLLNTQGTAAAASHRLL